ncbi:MAG: SDR family NAD(P)-dependent oxidoreductase [Pseudomonadota bacterium]
MDLSGKTAVITGAASGIGFALAEKFAASGMQVVLSDVQKDALQRAAEALTERGAIVKPIITDVMSIESVMSLERAAVSRFGPIHVLCNNAGVASATSQLGVPVWEQPIKDWDWVLGVNFYGVLHGLRAFVPGMLTHGESGHILNTASLAGLLAGGGSYNASKHTLISLSETLYFDLKNANANIRASVLCPSLVRTEFFSAERNRPTTLQSDIAAPAEPEGMADLLAILQANATGPEEIAAAAVEGMKNNDFYILPNPAWDQFVRERVEHVLARKQPAVAWDMTELAERYMRGEKL